MTIVTPARVSERVLWAYLLVVGVLLCLLLRDLLSMGKLRRRAAALPLRIEVQPSSGPGDVQTVRGRIEFRPAILDLRGPAGSSASCGPLGVFPVPSQQQIPISSPSVRVSCQLLPAPGSAEQPKEFDVTLKPGRLSTNLGQ